MTERVQDGETSWRGQLLGPSLKSLGIGGRKFRSGQIISARNGTEALEILDNLVRLPDYVFLDINMPSMDGKACLKNLKRDHRVKSFPVIIYTTNTNKIDNALPSW